MFNKLRIARVFSWSELPWTGIKIYIMCTTSLFYTKVLFNISDTSVFLFDFSNSKYQILITSGNNFCITCTVYSFSISIMPHPGFAIGRVGKQFRMCWFHSSVFPNRCSCRTKPDCLCHRSSLLGYRFGRSEGSGFPVCFRRLR